MTLANPPLELQKPGIMAPSEGVIRIKPGAVDLIHSKMCKQTRVESIVKYVETNYPGLRVTSVKEDTVGRWFLAKVEEK